MTRNWYLSLLPLAGLGWLLLRAVEFASFLHGEGGGMMMGSIGVVGMAVLALGLVMGVLRFMHSWQAHGPRRSAPKPSRQQEPAFDPDEVMARYLAKRAATLAPEQTPMPAASTSPAPATPCPVPVPPLPAPASRTFGRKAV